ncbi:hypothetical protein Lfu02_74160 [Longispora fulva]|uniref:Sulfur relay (Sulfurtransferase) complex TusBCD TusD component (DsrE family) n=1 Tax=Longispora fulva TaxID=619741 RepID=A0A8J7G7I5_9ACTN|nr:hypothetical protein [Longispora fulva]MBG6134335.1 sulfur relay (sulfurtransferase) complex TusBCD TusD component (DsrE family) [Longispora fulva]GIG63044.1 hypothetical protein Lfu02_74160 [Longispora fulva]
MAARPPADVLLVVTGAPFASDMLTTVLRLVDELLRRGRSVLVWACGYTTMLTQTALGGHKPRDLDDWAARHPSTAAVVSGLLAEYAALFSWEVCTYCAQDRGAGPHVPGVRLRAPSRIGTNVAAARTTIYIGGA